MMWIFLGYFLVKLAMYAAGVQPADHRAWQDGLP